MPAIRQLAAIMFTDMVGYTVLMQSNELEEREAVIEGDLAFVWWAIE